jgi:hypothetical protein
MKSQSPEGTSMQKEREALLKTIIADKQTTNAERQAAESELAGDRQDDALTVPQSHLDRELLNWLDKGKNVATFSRIEARRNSSATARRLLDDISNSNLTAPADPGAVARLTNLVAATQSPIVREAALNALEFITYYEGKSK